MTETYTNRRLEHHIVKDIEFGKNGWWQITTYESTGFSFKPDQNFTELLGFEAGSGFTLELRGFSQVTGVMVNDTWVMRKSDQDLVRDHERFVQNRRADLINKLHKNERAWREREAALPEWIRARIEYFHERGGFNFAVEGWAYELNVAELAVMYRESGGEENATISEYARLHGTSGNQHEVAKALAASPPDVSLAETISALTPLGSGPYYEKEAANG